MRPIELEIRGTVDLLATALEERILDGELGPGTPLRESRIAADLRLSRNSVREAIRGLVPIGLVCHEPNRGFVVTEPTTDDVLDLYQARQVLELSAARAPFATLQTRVPGLEEAVDGLVETQENADWGGLFRAHRQFHAELVGALECERLERFLRRVFGELRLAMARVEQDRDRREVEEEHRVLIDRILAGDRRGLVREMKRHLARGEERVLARMTRERPEERSR